VIIRAYKDDDLPETLAGSCSVALGYADCEQPAAKPRREGYTVRVHVPASTGRDFCCMYRKMICIVLINGR